jgi:Ca-activated chloride channel family protein
VDVSGSMHGFPLDISKTLLRNLLTNLRPTDCFNVELFSGVSAVMSEKSLPVNEQNIEDAIAFINKEQGSGGTEVLPALTRALALPRTEGVSRTIVIATDGYVTVETEAFDLIRKNLGKANMFAFGIGSGVNRFIIEGMAHVGMGEPFIIEKPEAATAQAEKFRKYIETPVLTGIDVAYNGFEVYDVEPKTIPDVLAERPIIIFGKWRGRPEGSIMVTGRGGAGKYRQALALDGAKPSEDNSALRYLWARHMVQILADYNNLAEDSGRVKEITALGLKYSLLTQYTSFVAIDKKVRNIGGKQETVEQVLPLPQGVSDYAVGGSAATGFAGKSLGWTRSMPSAVSADAMQELKTEERTPAGRVKVTRVEVQGNLDRNAAAAAVRKLLADIEASYQSELSTDPGLAGKMEIEFVVQPDGKAGSVKVLANELNAAIEHAAKTLVAKLSYPKSAAGATVRVEFTFGN